MSSTFDIAIGRQLRRYRSLRGMTQQDLATRLGISFQQVQKYEHGTNKLSFERAYHLSEIFNVPLANWLPPEPPGRLENDRQALHMLRAFHSIASDEKRRLVIGVATALGEGGAMPV